MKDSLVPMGLSKTRRVALLLVIVITSPLRIILSVSMALLDLIDRTPKLVLIRLILLPIKVILLVIKLVPAVILQTTDELSGLNEFKAPEFDADDHAILQEAFHTVSAENPEAVVTKCALYVRGLRDCANFYNAKNELVAKATLRNLNCHFDLPEIGVEKVKMFYLWAAGITVA